MNLVEAARLNDEQAREYMESLRWPTVRGSDAIVRSNVTKTRDLSHYDSVRVQKRLPLPQTNS